MNKVPELRFAGFDGEWVRKKLSEIATINPKSSKLPSEFNYVDLSSVVGTGLLGTERFSIKKAPSRAKRLAKKGDIFYQTVRPYQKNNYLFELDCNEYVFSTGYAQLRTKSSPRFLFSIMQTSRFVDTVMNRTTGTSFPAISTNDLSDIELKITEQINEQEKIGNLFKNIDQMIENQEALVEGTKNFKKSMLQKMFPNKSSIEPQIRFNLTDYGFDSGILNDFIVTHGSKNYITEPLDSGRYKVIQQGDIPVSGYSDASPYEDFKNVILFGDHTLSLYNPDEPFLLATDGIKIIYVENIDTDYFYYLLQSIMPQSQGYKRHYKILRSIKVKIVKSDIEQEKIGKFFKNLDKKIEKEQELLDSYKMMKKSLLQKIFV